MHALILLFRKNPIEKIRVSLCSPQRAQFVYTQKLYSFQTENATIEPINIQEICEQAEGNSQNECDGAAAGVDKSQNELSFNHEWTHQKVINTQAFVRLLLNYSGKLVGMIFFRQIFIFFSNLFCIRIMRQLLSSKWTWSILKSIQVVVNLMSLLCIMYFWQMGRGKNFKHI